ncbi:MAG: hypothetical protein K2Q12_09640 [Rickettsiales bacterium]|nr:hypothetical protein [Rickettsiales bacterium]
MVTSAETRQAAIHESLVAMGQPDGAFSQLRAARKTLGRILEKYMDSPAAKLSEEEKIYLSPKGVLLDGIYVSDQLISQAPPTLDKQRLEDYRRADQQRIYLAGHHGLSGEFGNGIGYMETVISICEGRPPARMDVPLQRLCSVMREPSQHMRFLTQQESIRPLAAENNVQAAARVVRNIHQWIKANAPRMAPDDVEVAYAAIHSYEENLEAVKGFLRTANLYVEQRQGSELAPASFGRA